MMMTLGLFVFGLDTLAYQSLQRTTQYRYGRNNRIGKRAASQYLGPGADTITLPGTVHLEMGDMSAIEQLRTMANRGEPYVLVSAQGKVYGLWEIDEITESQELFLPNGEPRKNDFSIKLTRADDDRIDQLGLVTNVKELLQ